jgi:16S rRNA (guanine966-N2)-methyltransferase
MKSTKIISGEIAGRSISIVGCTRPPLLRIRRCIFDILGDVSGQRVLDLCAGSGSLGIEAISRGARYVYFVEENVHTLRNLTKNLSNMRVNTAKVIRMNVKFLPKAEEGVDLIFFDPPFGHAYVGIIADKLISKGWIHPETTLVVRTDHLIKDWPNWTEVKICKIGISFIYVLKPAGQN